MTAINVVRFRVKPGRETEFVDAHRDLKLPGNRRVWLIKTGDRDFCIVGLWNELKDLAAARPAMIANLDKMRGSLEDLGGGLGVTDPVSGEVVLSLGGKEGGGKHGGGGKGGGAGGGGGAKHASASAGGGGGKHAGAGTGGAAAVAATSAGAAAGKRDKAARKAARAAKRAGKGKPK